MKMLMVGLAVLLSPTACAPAASTPVVATPTPLPVTATAAPAPTQVAATATSLPSATVPPSPTQPPTAAATTAPPTATTVPATATSAVPSPTSLPFPYAKFTATDVDGEWTFAFSADATFKSTLKGAPVAAGTFSLDGDRITLHDIEGVKSCRTQGDGLYRWSFDGKQMRLEMVRDNCAPRRSTLNKSVWTLQP